MVTIFHRQLVFLTVIAALSAACEAGFAAPLNDGFADRSLTAYLANAERLYEDVSFDNVSGMTGKRCMVLTDDNRVGAEFLPVPISDQCAYELSFRGQWDNAETIENNPTFEAALHRNSLAYLQYVPTMTVAFLDVDGKCLGTLLQAMPYGNWCMYRNVFYPPRGSAFLQLHLKSGWGVGLFSLDNIRLEPLKSSPDCVTLDFRIDNVKCTGSIYGFQLADMKMDNSGGSHIFSGYGRKTSEIRLKGPGRYRMEFQGELMSEYGIVTLTVLLLDNKGRTIGEISSDRLNQKSLEFTLPPEASGVQLRVYNRLIDEIKFLKMEGESL